MQESKEIINIIKKIFPWIAGLAGILVFGFFAEAIESSDNLIKLSIAVLVIWGINHFWARVMTGQTAISWEEKYKELLLETKIRRTEWIRILDKLEKINNWRGEVDPLDFKELYDNDNYINTLEKELRSIRRGVEKIENDIDEIEEDRDYRLEYYQHIDWLEKELDLIPAEELVKKKRVTPEMIKNWQKQVLAENMKREKETKDILEMKKNQEKILKSNE